MVYIHIGLIVVWLALAYYYYDGIEFVQEIKKDYLKLQEAATEWYNKTMLMYDRANQHCDETEKELKECRKLKDELQQKRTMEEALKRLGEER